MPELTPRQLLLCGLALLGLAVFAIVYAGRDDGGVAAAPRGGSAPSLEVRGEGDGGGLTVHVAGAVRRPGVYRLRAGARVGDAVERAGGARRRADLGAVNLAAELQDGRQVLVPLRARGGVTAAGGVAPGVPLDLNTATVEQLDELDGIGPATAQQIVAYREAHGGFGSVEELDQVPGIGETRLAAIREKVRV